MRFSTLYPIAALAVCLTLAGCVEPASTFPGKTGSADASLAAEVSRLQSLGFRPAGRPAPDGAVRLTYSGPVTGAVLCAPRGASPVRLQARTALAGGGRQSIDLDAYVTLSPGPDGILSPSERDGLYVVTIVSKGASGSDVQGITFGPSGQASFRSGLSCRAA